MGRGGGGGGKGDARVNDFFFFFGGEGTRVSDFFTKNPNLKNKRFYFSLFGGGGGGGGSEVARLSEFLQRIQIYK